MSSNGSEHYEYDVDIDDLMAPEDDTPAAEVARQLREEEVERFKLGSVLTMIEISSCFRTGPEPLFDLIGPMLWTSIRL